MAIFDEITITRSDLNSLEGATLRRYKVDLSEDCVLGVSETDKFMLDSAKRDVKIDLSGRISHLVEDNTYGTTEEALNAISAVDTDDSIQRLIVLKFLELFFSDQATTVEDLNYRKAEIYHSSYNKSLNSTAKILLSNLNPPRSGNSVRFVRF